MKLFDSHAHLQDEQFDKDREELIWKIHNEGVEKFVSAGYSLDSSKESIELSKKYNLYINNLYKLLQLSLCYRKTYNSNGT